MRYETREALLGFGTKSSCPAMVLTPAGEAASAAWRRGRVDTASTIRLILRLPQRQSQDSLMASHFAGECAKRPPGELLLPLLSPEDERFSLLVKDESCLDLGSESFEAPLLGDRHGSLSHSDRLFEP